MPGIQECPLLNHNHLLFIAEYVKNQSKAKPFEEFNKNVFYQSDFKHIKKKQ